MVRSFEAICLMCLLLVGLSNLFYAAAWGAIRLFGNKRKHASLRSRERMLIAAIFLPIVCSICLTCYSVWTALTCNDVLKESSIIGPCVHLARHMCFHLDSARLALAPALRAGELASIVVLLMLIGIAVWMLKRHAIKWLAVTSSRKLATAWKRARHRFSNPAVRLAQIRDCPSGAMLVGWRTPACLVSSWLVRRSTALELEVVLKHELTHALRGDNLKRTLMKMMRILSLFSPACGTLCCEWERTAEFICDDLAVQDGNEASALAHALLITLKRTSLRGGYLGPDAENLIASTLALPQESLTLDRIHRLIHYQPSRTKDVSEWWFEIGLFFCLGAVSSFLAATLHCAAETLMRLPFSFWSA